MTGSLSKMFERILMCLVFFIVSAMFFLLYQSEYKADIAERATREFLDGVSSSGSITRQEFEYYLMTMAGIEDYNIRLTYTAYSKEPYYGYYSSEEIRSYYALRNQRIQHPVTSGVPDVEVVDTRKLFLQRGSNASVLAGLLDDVRVALPVDGVIQELTYTVFSQEQEVYVGEALTTMLLAQQDGIMYYCMADDAIAAVPGTYMVPLTVNGTSIGKSIQVTAWDKMAVCANEHRYPSTAEVIEHYKSTGEWALCPYCETYVSELTLEPAVCTVPLGTPVEDLPIMVKASYFDGHTELLSFETVANDYVEGYAGAQDITVSYAGVTEVAGSIITESPLCRECGGMIDERSYADWQVEARCAECLQSIPVYLGEYISVANTTGNTAITEKLASSGEYSMGRGDYLTVEVYRNGNSMIGGIFPTSDMSTYFRIGSVIRRDAQ